MFILVLQKWIKLFYYCFPFLINDYNFYSCIADFYFVILNYIECNISALFISLCFDSARTQGVAVIACVRMSISFVINQWILIALQTFKWNY